MFSISFILIRCISRATQIYLWTKVLKYFHEYCNTDRLRKENPFFTCEKVITKYIVIACICCFPFTAKYIFFPWPISTYNHLWQSSQLQSVKITLYLMKRKQFYEIEDLASNQFIAKCFYFYWNVIKVNICNGIQTFSVFVCSRGFHSIRSYCFHNSCKAWA